MEPCKAWSRMGSKRRKGETGLGQVSDTSGGEVGTSHDPVAVYICLEDFIINFWPAH